jgi:hypothetical protein
VINIRKIIQIGKGYPAIDRRFCPRITLVMMSKISVISAICGLFYQAEQDNPAPPRDPVMPRLAGFLSNPKEIQVFRLFNYIKFVMVCGNYGCVIYFRFRQYN